MQKADVVLYDRLISQDILKLIPGSTRKEYVGKAPGRHSATQDQIISRMISLARQGNSVCRLKGGDPYVFGRGGEEAVALQAAGIPIKTVPGITAAIGAGASCGFPLTHRGLSQAVTFITGHSADESETHWTALVNLQHTLVFYMGVSQHSQIQNGLIAAGMAPEMKVAIIENATSLQQRVTMGTLEELNMLVSVNSIESPAIIIVGEIVSLGAILNSEALGWIEERIV